MKDRIARSVFWMVWSRGGVQSLSFLSTLLVARLLSPQDYGLMALAVVWVGAVELLSEMGLGAAIVQFRDLDQRELNACFWVTMGVATVGYAILFIAAPAISRWFDTPALTLVLRVSGLILPVLAFRVVPDGLLRKQLALDKISQAEIAASLVTIAVTVGLAWAGAGVWALVAGVLSIHVIQTLATFWFARWRPGLQSTSPRLKKIVRYSLASLGSRMSWGLLQQTDSLVLGKMAGEVVLGFYSMAMRLAALPVSKITVVANQLAIPIMAELQTDRVAMRASFLRGLRLVTCLTVPLCTGAALVAPDLISIVLTDKWLPVVPLLQVLSIYAMIRSVDTLLPSVLSARYRVAYLMRWNLAVLIVMPAAFWAGATWAGPLGVALAWVLVYPFLTALLAREAFRELQVTWSSAWEQVRPFLFAAIMMAGVVLIIYWIVPGTDSRTRLIRIFLASGVGALVYAFSIFRHSGPVSSEIAEIAGWIFRRKSAVHAPLNR